MLKHGLIYFLGRFGASAISLLSVAIYTRLLSPDAYGVYALVLSAAMMAYAGLSQWLTFALARFLPAYQGHETVVGTHVALAYATIAAMVVLGVLAVLPWVEGGEIRLVLLMGGVIFLVMSPAEMVMTSFQMRSRAGRYVQLALLRAVVTTLVGLLLVWLGWGSLGLLVGVVAGHLCILAVCLQGIGGAVHGFALRRSLLRELIAYGLPAALTSALGAFIYASDRYIIGLLLGVEAAGLYAAPYDLTMRSLHVLMIVVAMAGNPIVMRTYESDGEAAARPLMLRQAELLLAVGLPATIACALLAPAIATLLLGQAFRASAVQLMPWIALGTLLIGFQALYVALAFSLPRKPLQETWVIALGALLNLVLNLLLIPRWGLVGAAVATVAAYAFILVVTLHIGRRLMPLPLPVAGLAKILAACALWAAILWPVRQTISLLPVAMHAIVAAAAYGLMLSALDVGGTRRVLVRAGRLARSAIQPARP